jgi:hypothetical protein
MKHKVRSHRWHNGRLRVTEMEFDSFEEAQAHAESRFGSDSVKVYDENSELVASITPTVSDTYA